MRDIRALTWLSLALFCACSGNADDKGLATDAGKDALSPEAGASDSGASNLDAGMQDGGSAGQSDSGTVDGGNGSGTHDGGGADSGVARDGGMDAALDAGPGLDAGRDSGPKTINGYPVGDHCAPGEYAPMFSPFCVDLDGGQQSALEAGIGAIPNAEDVHVRWQRLAIAMKANEPYAISHEVSTGGPPGTQQFEIWGAMSPCATGGEQADRLGMLTAEIGNNVYCLDLHPTKAYSHVMFVYRINSRGPGTSSASYGQTYCPMGSCPAR